MKGLVDKIHRTLEWEKGRQAAHLLQAIVHQALHG